MRLCACGCGQPTKLAKLTSIKHGRKAGQPNKYLFGHARIRSGVNYVQGGDDFEHRQIAAKALGKPLPPKAQVHHVDDNRRNNANSNLVICQDMAYHKLLHVRTRIVRAGGNPNTERLCSRCRRVLPLEAFGRSTARQSGTQNACRSCGTEYRRAAKTRVSVSPTSQGSPRQSDAYAKGGAVLNRTRETTAKS